MCGKKYDSTPKPSAYAPLRESELQLWGALWVRIRIGPISSKDYTPHTQALSLSPSPSLHKQSVCSKGLPIIFTH